MSMNPTSPNFIFTVLCSNTVECDCVLCFYNFSNFDFSLMNPNSPEINPLELCSNTPECNCVTCLNRVSDLNSELMCAGG
jgi:hypothetical protein